MYSTDMNAQVEEYLAALAREWAIPWIDARTWVADDGFWDAHHLLPDAAATFSAQLQCQALRPLLGRREGTR
jgi:hypothetical protein